MNLFSTLFFYIRPTKVLCSIQYFIFDFSLLSIFITNLNIEYDFENRKNGEKPTFFQKYRMQLFRSLYIILALISLISIAPVESKKITEFNNSTPYIYEFCSYPQQSLIFLIYCVYSLFI